MRAGCRFPVWLPYCCFKYRSAPSPPPLFFSLSVCDSFSDYISFVWRVSETDFQRCSVAIELPEIDSILRVIIKDSGRNCC